MESINLDGYRVETIVELCYPRGMGCIGYFSPASAGEFSKGMQEKPVPIEVQFLTKDGKTGFLLERNITIR